MQHRIYTVYDAKAEAYLLPYYAKTIGLAIRSFEAAVADPNHDFGKYREDYTLFELGFYDDEKAEFEMLEAPRPVMGALEVRLAEVENG